LQRAGRVLGRLLALSPVAHITSGYIDGDPEHDHRVDRVQRRNEDHRSTGKGVLQLDLELEQQAVVLPALAPPVQRAPST